MKSKNSSSNTVAVVIPMFNASSTILRALHGVFTQTHQPDEVIIVNDGSTDDSLHLVNCSEYASKLTLITVSNGGPSNARNVGVKNAKSEWVAFLDADDEWCSNEKLANQLAIIEQHKDTVIVDTFAKVFWPERGVIKRSNLNNGSVFEGFLFSNIINATSSVLARRASIIKAGGFDVAIKFGEDRLLWATLAKMGSCRTLPEYSVYKENHDSNLTSKWRNNYHYRELLVKKLIGLYEQRNYSDSYIWFVNGEEFLKLALRNKEWKTYRTFSRYVASRAALRFIFSKYSILYCLSFAFSLVNGK